MSNRPKRLYQTKSGRIFYLVKGKRKYLKDSVKIPDKGGLILNTIKRKPRKKVQTERLRTAFALNPIHAYTPTTTGLPIHFATQEKQVFAPEDIIKNEITTKQIKQVEAIEKAELSSALKKIGEASVRANKNVKANIRNAFKDYATTHGDKQDKATWFKFQQTGIYKNKNGKSKSFSNYDYLPPLAREKTYEDETTDYEEEGKRHYSEEERDLALLRNMETPVASTKRKKLPKLSLESEESLTEGRGSDGLYNTDIEAIMKGLKHGPVPVICSDKIGMLPDYVHKGMKKFGAIINTNPSTSDGSGKDGYRVGHWRGIFFDNDEDGRVSCEYFDPLCEGTIPPALKKVMIKVAEKMNPEDYFLVKENNLKRQSNTTSTCGFHSIKFIDDRMNGVPWSEATGYDEYMAKNKPDDSIAGEIALEKPMKKYDKYI